ncbi:MAG: hypothetical protein RL384_1027 [Actinomycetota bacterium]
MIISEPTESGLNSSKLSVQPGWSSSTDTRGDWLWCSGPDDKTCDTTNPKLDLLAWTIIPHCSLSDSPYCLEKLEVAAPGQDFKDATFVRRAAGGLTHRADSKTALIEASTPSIFEAPDAPNAGGSNGYSVAVRIDQHFNHRTGKYEPGNVIADVSPFKERQGNYTPLSFIGGDPRYSYEGGGVTPGCVWLEVGKCGYRQDYVEGTKVRLTIKVPSSLGGWFSGRMKDPQISVEAASPEVSRLVVAAEPVVIPQLAYAKKKSEIKVEKTFNIGRGGTGQGEFWGVTSGGPGGEDVFKFINLYREAMRDTAVGTITAWNMMTIAGNNGNYCLNDKSKVLGIVTTNAMGYDTGSPTFSGGFLNYKVGGLHFMPDGKTEVQGTYDLVMRSETARCLYGFTKAPISATVSVVGGDNAPVATTIVRESNGWLKMAAYGFTFSEKTVRVKMTQKPAPAKTTITCVKGKTVKKITAVGPKCPVGFKKK